MNPLHRLIDVNANRAREGLRLLEDLARFVLNRAELSRAAKDIRHEISTVVDSLPLDPVHRLAARDTEGDVGTTISAGDEYARSGTAAMALAAAGRATEALRCLEEAAKALANEAVARRFETARYSLYTLERELVLSLPTGHAPQWRLCVLVTASMCLHHSWEKVVERSIAGGADCIQLREKNLGDAELLIRSRRLVEVCRATPPHAAAIINDRPDIAILSGADGVHLGQGDLPVRAARELLGSRLIIGVSTTNITEARAAHRAGADVIGLGPMFPSTTKQKDTIAGPEYVRSMLADEHLAALPHLAIGGITPERMPELCRAGVRGVAVSSVVCGAEDPEGVCQSLLGGLGVVPPVSAPRELGRHAIE